MTFTERFSQVLWGNESEEPPSPVDQPSSKASSGGSEADDQKALHEVEAALKREKARSGQKDQELALLQQLLSKLESSIEEQAKDAQLEQARISTLEKTLAQQQAKQQVVELHGQPVEADEKIEKLLLAVAGERQIAEERQRQINKLQDQLQEEESKRRCAAEALSHLRHRVSEEEALRRDVERKLAEKHEEFTKLQRRLPSQFEEIDLKAELVEQTQEFAKGDLIRERKSTCASTIGSLDGREDLDRQKGVHAMLMQKEREVCDLQQQLSEELGKRREVQQQNIERERLVLEKDHQMVELQTEIAVFRRQRMQRSSGALLHSPQVQLSLRNLESEESFSDNGSSRTSLVPEKYGGGPMQFAGAQPAAFSRPATVNCTSGPASTFMTTPSVSRRRAVGLQDNSAGGLVFNCTPPGTYAGVQVSAPQGVGTAQQVMHRGFAFGAPSASGALTRR